jgi:hypothetical protein
VTVFGLFNLIGKVFSAITPNARGGPASEIIGVQPNTAIRFYMGLRFLIASQLPSYELNGKVEADESYFGGI